MATCSTRPARQSSKLSNLGAYCIGILSILLLATMIHIVHGLVFDLRWDPVPSTTTSDLDVFIRVAIWFGPVSLAAAIMSRLAPNLMRIVTLIIATSLLFLFLMPGDESTLLSEALYYDFTYAGGRQTRVAVLLLALPLPAAWIGQHTVGFRRPRELSQSRS